MAIAFFDLDLTLLGQNSGRLWVKRQLREGHISAWQAFQAGIWLFKYQLGFAKMDSALLTAIQSLAGKEEVDMRERTHLFYDEEVKSLYRPGGMKALEAHRKAGDLLVLLTASSNYLSEKVMEDLGLDAILCNHFETDDGGIFTGLPEGPLCYGEGKTVHAQRLADAEGIDLKTCYFYTDSSSDLPVMYAVGHPVAIAPDPRLKREALKQGWPIEDWG